MRYLTCFFLVITLNIFSQSDIEFGFLPKFNVSKKLATKLKWASGLEAREQIYDDDNFVFKHNLLDFSNAISFKTNLNKSATIGYIVRIIESKTFHRFFQHYNFIQKLNNLKLGHRFAFEQHFSNTTSSFYRFRYRITAQKPLNGEKIDIKEFYLKLGNEYVWNITSENIELRFSLYLGYRINENNKLEIGLEHRTNNLLVKLNKHRFWFRTSWYINL